MKPIQGRKLDNKQDFHETGVESGVTFSTVAKFSHESKGALKKKPHHTHLSPCCLSLSDDSLPEEYKMSLFGIWVLPLESVKSGTELTVTGKGDWAWCCEQQMVFEKVNLPDWEGS